MQQKSPGSLQLSCNYDYGLILDAGGQVGIQQQSDNFINEVTSATEASVAPRVRPSNVYCHHV